MAWGEAMRRSAMAKHGGAIPHAPPGRRPSALYGAIALVALCAGCEATGYAEAAKYASGDGVGRWGADEGGARNGVPAGVALGAPALATVSDRAPGAEAALTSFGEAAEEEPATQPEEATRRLRIYAAHLEILVAAVEDSVTRFIRRVDEAGGFLEKRDDASVTCRVPAAKFKEILEEVKAYGLVTRESVRATDVTKQYFDLKIRIENAEKARERLMALLERAEEVEDALRIETELRRLAEEIDRLKGELKYLSEQIAFSTIEVVFQTNAPPPRAMPKRARSRFDWINRVGVEHVLEEF